MSSILEDIFRKTSDTMLNIGYRVSGQYNYINNVNFPIFADEVERDINAFRQFMDLAKFERDKEPALLILVSKYQNNYCPSAYSKWFSTENQLEYLYLRTQVDDILKKLEEPFSDFLSE